MLLYRDDVQCGKRCSAVTPPLYFDPLDKIFHEIFRPGRNAAPVQFIYNSKKGFYVINDGVVNEYFRDSYEGWWIRSYYGGSKGNFPCSASERYKQCLIGLRLNTAAYEAALRAARGSAG
jgi:hypothetical protein